LNNQQSVQRLSDAGREVKEYVVFNPAGNDIAEPKFSAVANKPEHSWVAGLRHDYGFAPQLS
jgi:hypothetical protein